MKTIEIPLPGAARIYLTISRGGRKVSGSFMGDGHAELEEKLDARFSMPASRREAHWGNAFAGPHCVFDPRFSGGKR